MIDKYNVFELLNNLKIKKGDAIIVHSDAMILAQFENFKEKIDFNNFFQNIINYIGKEGTLIIPTFTYSATKEEIYEPLKSESKVGLLSNEFLKFKNISRTSHPIFSFAIIGYYKNKILKHNNFSCFGIDSIFSLFHKISSKILCLGCSSKNSITFMHHIEEIALVPYRKYIYFKGEISNERNNIFVECKYYARDLDLNIDTRPSLNLFKNFLNKIDQSFFIETTHKRIIASSINTSEFYDYALPLLKKYPFLFIEEGEKVYKDICL